MRFSLLPLVLVASCAHTALSPEKQEAYFSCEGLSLEQAEANLALEGWPIKTVGNASITTEPIDVQLPAGETIMIPLAADAMRFEFKSKAYKANIVVGKGLGAVRFSLFLEGRKLSALSQEQVTHESSRAQLNKLRKAVCGAGFFGETL